MDYMNRMNYLLPSVEPLEPLPTPDIRDSLRRSVGLTLAEAARILGVSPLTLGGWETAKHTPQRRYAEMYGRFLASCWNVNPLNGWRVDDVDDEPDEDGPLCPRCEEEEAAEQVELGYDDDGDWEDWEMDACEEVGRGSWE